MRVFFLSLRTEVQGGCWEWKNCILVSALPVLSCVILRVSLAVMQFCYYKIVHTLILTDMELCHQWVKQINEELD